jgi:hypothetical protein
MPFCGRLLWPPVPLRRNLLVSRHKARYADTPYVAAGSLEATGSREADRPSRPRHRYEAILRSAIVIMTLLSSARQQSHDHEHVPRPAASVGARGVPAELAAAAPPRLSTTILRKLRMAGFCANAIYGDELWCSFAVSDGLQSHLATVQTANEGNIYDGQS